MTVERGESMTDTGNRMEPNRGPARLSDDVGSALVRDDAEVPHVQLQVQV